MTRARVLARVSPSRPAVLWPAGRQPARRAQARRAEAPCLARHPWAVGWTPSPPIIRSDAVHDQRRSPVRLQRMLADSPMYAHGQRRGSGSQASAEQIWRNRAARAQSLHMKRLRSSILVEHDLFRKPVPTFRDHALSAKRRKTRLALVPPKPKEFDSTMLIGFSRGLCGTRSMAVATEGLSRLIVGGTMLSRIANRQKIDSTAPAAPSKWPIDDFVDDMAMRPAALPTRRSTALSSISSPSGVEVPWALI